MPVPKELAIIYLDMLQEAYTGMRKKWNPRWNRKLTQVSDDQWFRCAELLALYNLDPYAYVSYMFDEFGNVRGDVYETQVASFNMIEGFRQLRPKQIQDAQLLMRLNADSFKTQLGNGHSIDDILEDPNGEYSCVFKYAVAVSKKLPKWVELYEPQAKFVMTFEPTYEEFLGKYLKKDQA